MPEGTQFEVRDLFWNTPARLKFLKSEATETAAVSEAVLRLSLAYPEVHFRLKANGRQLMDLPPHRDLPERVRAALARRGATLLHEARGEEAGVKVRAFLGPPEDASTTPRSTLLFVARRFVRDRSLLHALCMGYGELLEKGRYPMSALFVEVPGEELDINVHPQKLEVRFARPQEVYGAVRHVVGQAIAQAPWLAPVDTHAYSLPPEHLDESPHSASEPLRRPVVAEPRSRSLSGATTKGSPPIRSLFETKRIELQAIAAVSPMGESHPPTTPGFFSSLGYVGQAHNTYLLCENEAALIIVDQHAAHERILFERLRQAHRQKVVPQQRLLFPIPIELPDELAAMTTQAFVPLALAELGFETEPFGLKTLLLRSVPELLKNADPKPLLLDVLAGLSGEESAHLTEERMDKLFATMACHAALRGGDSILPESARALLSQLDGVDMRSHCPHGRPVLLQFSWSEIEGRLERT